MDGVGGTVVSRILGPRAAGFVICTGRFGPNGTLSPLQTTFQGSLSSKNPSATGASAAGMFTVTRVSPGLWTVAFPLNTKFKFKVGQFPTISVQSVCADITAANRFWATRVGDWVNATRSFQIQAVQSEAAFDPPANANNWVDFVLTAPTDR